MAVFHGIFPLMRRGGDLNVKVWRRGRRNHGLLLVVVLMLGLLLLLVSHVVVRSSRRGGRDDNGRRRRLRCEGIVVLILLSLRERLAWLHLGSRRSCCCQTLMAALSPALWRILDFGVGVALWKISTRTKLLSCK